MLRLYCQILEKKQSSAGSINLLIPSENCPSGLGEPFKRFYYSMPNEGMDTGTGLDVGGRQEDSMVNFCDLFPIYSSILWLRFLIFLTFSLYNFLFNGMGIIHSFPLINKLMGLLMLFPLWTEFFSVPLPICWKSPTAYSDPMKVVLATQLNQTGLPPLNLVSFVLIIKVASSSFSDTLSNILNFYILNKPWGRYYFYSHFINDYLRHYELKNFTQVSGRTKAVWFWSPHA